MCCSFFKIVVGVCSEIERRRNRSSLALRNPTNDECQGICKHVHNDSCSQCSQLPTLLSTLERKCLSEQLPEEDRAEILYVFVSKRGYFKLEGPSDSFCSPRWGKTFCAWKSRPSNSIIGSRLGYEIYATERGAVRLVCKAWFGMA